MIVIITPCKLLTCRALFDSSLSFSAILLLLSSRSLSTFWLIVFNSSFERKMGRGKTDETVISAVPPFMFMYAFRGCADLQVFGDLVFQQ